MKISFLLLLFTSLVSFGAIDSTYKAQKKPLVKTEDSLKIWIKKSKDPKLTKEQKLLLAQKAYQLVLQTGSDTLRSKYLSTLSENQKFIPDSALFRSINNQTLVLNQKLKDSLAVGYANWDLALFFKKYAVKDSAYYSFSKAQRVFENINKKQFSGRMYLEMAKIQVEIKDYIGCQNNTTKAIKTFKTINDNINLYYSYNILGISTGALGEAENSLTYYKEALYYLRKEPRNKFNEARIFNNIGVVYRNNKQYLRAIQNFDKVLNTDSLEFKQPILYAIALSNLASCKIYNNDTTGVNDLLLKAIDIKIVENQKFSLAETYLIYAKYKIKTNDTLSAIAFAKNSEKLSSETENNEAILKSWEQLARLDKKNASIYFQKYTELTENLQKEERKIQNKFARIQFETDEFIAENIELESEKNQLSKQNQIWIGIAAVLSLLALSIYIIINQRAKNQKLRFDQQQQVNNQEIFNLMLTQKQKVDEVKRMEQKRISEELHDGVLGKMLGARMILTGLNKRVTDEAIQEKSKALGSLQEIENEIRSISHELSHSAYQKINNFTDSIESLLDGAKRNVAIKTFFTYNEDEDWDSLDGEIKINVYRIIQETFQNAIKHAKCTTFEITFNRRDEHFTIMMSDNGIGFKNTKGKRGIGIRNISSRINKLNGTWNIDSAKNKGTTISMQIPIENIPNNSTDNNTQYKNV